MVIRLTEKGLWARRRAVDGFGGHGWVGFLTAGDIALMGRSAEEDLQLVSRGSPLPALR